MFTETFRETLRQPVQTKEEFEQIVRKVVSACDALRQGAEITLQITETLMEQRGGCPLDVLGMVDTTGI